MPIAGFVSRNVDTGRENHRREGEEEEFRSIEHDDASFYAKLRTVGNADT
jgi:hypothetical protein